MWPKTVDCIFIGYASNSSVYRFLLQKSDIPDIYEGTIIESRNAFFFEDIFPSKDRKEATSQSRTYDTTQDGQPNEPEARRSKRAKIAKSFGPDCMTYVVDDEPRTFNEAMLSPEAPYLKEAIKREIDPIMQNHTWELVDLPPGNKPLGCKWIFKKKLKPEGFIDKYKARLVSKGFGQK